MPKLVLGEGPLDCRIAFIGEAPGEYEEKFSRPFIGQSGSVFSACTAATNIRREDCRVTNVVKERPPGNDVSRFVHRIDKGKRKGEVVMTDAYRVYERDLYEELRGCTANVLVPMGNVALWALARKWGIDNWRGSIIESVPELNGRKVVPTFHPASILPGRDPLSQIPLKLDLHRIRDESEYPEIRRTARAMRIYPSFDESLTYIKDCTSLPEVGFDIETRPCGGTPDQPDTWEMVCFSLARSSLDSVCVPFAGPQGLYFTEEQQAAILLALAELLEKDDVIKVGQNINYDCSFMLAKYGVYCWPVFDTLIAQRLLLTDFSVGLSFICSLFTDIPYYKGDGKVVEGEVRNWDEFYEYSCKDSLVCMEAKPKQLKELEKLHNTEVYHRHVATLPSLMFMQERGILADAETLKALSEQMLGEIAEAEEALLAKVQQKATHFKNVKDKDTPFTTKMAGSNSQCSAYFYGVLKNKPYTVYDKKTGKSKTTTDETAMIRLLRKGVEEAADVLAIRKKKKLRGTYLEMRLDDGRFKTSFKPCVETGRLSSSANIFGYGGNLQTIPREGPFKKAFLPDDGYVLLSVDSSQAEARILAYCGRVQSKVAAFESGQDVYALTASKVAQRLGYSLTPDEILAEHAAKKLAPIAGEKSTWRQLGKVCDLALGYNMGPNTFSMDNELPLKDARTLHTAWHLVYPEVRNNYHAMIESMLNKDRVVINPFGRRRKFLGSWNDDTKREAYAHFCQSTVADLIAESALIPMLTDPLFEPVELLLQIHDSVVFQVPLAVGWDDITWLTRCVQANMSRSLEWQGIAFSIPAKVEASGVSLGQTVELDEVTTENLKAAYERSKGEVR